MTYDWPVAATLVMVVATVPKLVWPEKHISKVTSTIHSELAVITNKGSVSKDPCVLQFLARLVFGGEEEMCAGTVDAIDVSVIGSQGPMLLVHINDMVATPPVALLVSHISILTTRMAVNNR